MPGLGILRACHFSLWLSFWLNCLNCWPSSLGFLSQFRVEKNHSEVKDRQAQACLTADMSTEFWMNTIKIWIGCKWTGVSTTCWYRQSITIQETVTTISLSSVCGNLPAWTEGTLVASLPWLIQIWHFWTKFCTTWFPWWFHYCCVAIWAG